MGASPPEPKRSSLDIVDLLKYIGSPIAVGAALLFYFGWVRSNEQAALFGADISVFEMSPDDLVLRSVSVVFWVVLALVLLGLLFLRIHPWILDHASQASKVLLWSWLLVPIGFGLFVIDKYVATLLLPIFVLLAVAGMAYGARLRRLARGQGPPPLAQDLLVGALLVVVSFWSTERLARAVGDSQTRDLQIGFEKAPSLTLFSEGQLHISGPGIMERPLVGANSRYAYSYDGLYLLQRSGDKYFLVTKEWSQSGHWAGRLVVLPDDNTIRLEFTPPTPSPTPSPPPTSAP
jgi:hypothetical protein